jgi:diacylglycerol kinase family enzyme
VKIVVVVGLIVALLITAAARAAISPEHATFTLHCDQQTLRRCGDKDSLEFRSITRCRVEAVPQLPVQIEGEPAGETPVTVVVVPAVLTLVAPATAGADDD